jgi:hypothetical protein
LPLGGELSQVLLPAKADPLGRSRIALATNKKICARVGCERLSSSLVARMVYIGIPLDCGVRSAGLRI